MSGQKRPQKTGTNATLHNFKSMQAYYELQDKKKKEYRETFILCLLLRIVRKGVYKRLQAKRKGLLGIAETGEGDGDSGPREVGIQMGNGHIHHVGLPTTQ